MHWLCFYKRHITPSKKWIVTQIELDLCFDIIYLHTKFELYRCSLSKVIERTPNSGRTDGQGQHIMPLHHSSNGEGMKRNLYVYFCVNALNKLWEPLPNQIQSLFWNKKALSRSPEEKVKGVNFDHHGHYLNKFGRRPLDNAIYQIWKLWFL